MTSTIQTDYSHLNGKVTRVIQNVGNDCSELMTVDIEWSGSVLKDQIEREFFNAFRRRIVFSDDAENVAGESEPVPASLMQFQEYHSVHDHLQRLTGLSERYLKALENAKLDRKQLILPSGDQISQVTELVEPERFSIEKDVNEMKAEIDRTQRIVSEIKRARQQTSNSSVLPIFILASCTAAMFFVISRSKGPR